MAWYDFLKTVLVRTRPENPLGITSVPGEFHEAFEALDPATWNVTTASGDIVIADGNAAAASYLVISKDPLTANGETVVESVQSFVPALEAVLGLHASQRTVGQELVTEFVSTDAPIALPADVAIASISQSTTTLTVTTATAHSLKAGMRVGIRNVSDSRMNYPALVVASTPTATQFTATAGPGGTIPSVTAGPFTSGFVYYRPALGQAPDGASMIYEQASATQASFYVRSKAGDSLPSGTILGNHSITLGSSASVQAIAAALHYAFQPSTETRFVQLLDHVHWVDGSVDSTTGTNHRHKRSQVVPDPHARYKLRFRAVNRPSLSIPVAQIVSIAKTGTTTATVTCDRPHGLTSADVVTLYGPRDQTNFPNLTSATGISNVTATTFDVVIGPAVTATSYGGFVSRTNGGTNIQGVTSQVLQSVSRTANVVTAVGSGTWAGLTIGDLVNLVGVRDSATGASLGLDGPYRVRDLVTTSLVLEPVASAPTGADVVSTNCGGAVIRRTDLRVSYVRLSEFARMRSETTPRAGSDDSQAAPVSIKGISASFPAGNNTMGGVVLVQGTSPSVGTSASKGIAAASTNATVIKGSAGKLLGGTVFNASASAKFVKVYNKATAPTVGTDTPIFTWPVGPGQIFYVADAVGPTGHGFGTGIGIAITGAAADADTTALVAGDVIWNLTFV